MFIPNNSNKVVTSTSFELFTAGSMKSTVVWSVTPYSPLDVHRNCEGNAYSLFHGDAKNATSKKQAINLPRD